MHHIDTHTTHTQNIPQRCAPGCTRRQLPLLHFPPGKGHAQMRSESYHTAGHRSSIAPGCWKAGSYKLPSARGVFPKRSTEVAVRLPLPTLLEVNSLSNFRTPGEHQHKHISMHITCHRAWVQGQGRKSGLFCFLPAKALLERKEKWSHKFIHVTSEASVPATAAPTWGVCSVLTTKPSVVPWILLCTVWYRFTPGNPCHGRCDWRWFSVFPTQLSQGSSRPPLCFYASLIRQHSNTPTKSQPQTLEKPVTHFRVERTAAAQVRDAAAYFVLPACVWKSLSAAGLSLYITRAETTRWEWILGASGMAWWVKAPMPKPEDRTLIPGTCVVEGETRSQGRHPSQAGRAACTPPWHAQINSECHDQKV